MKLIKTNLLNTYDRNHIITNTYKMSTLYFSEDDFYWQQAAHDITYETTMAQNTEVFFDLLSDDDDIVEAWIKANLQGAIVKIIGPNVNPEKEPPKKLRNGKTNYWETIWGDMMLDLLVPVPNSTISNKFMNTFRLPFPYVMTI